MRDPNSYNMTELLVRVVNDILGAEIGSQAAGAGLNYTIEASMTGLSVSNLGKLVTQQIIFQSSYNCTAYLVPI